MALFPEQKITFQKCNELGKGSNGTTTVYSGNFGGRPVAVKVIYVTGEKRQRQVKTDIKTMITCDIHENVRRYICVEQKPDSDRILLALELCHASLPDWMKDNGCISPAKITKREILHQATKGLAYLHDKLIVHRDLKPSNILLAVDGNTVRVKISDFGISKFLAGESSSAAMSCVVGTEKWRAPEVLRYIDQMERREGGDHEVDKEEGSVQIKMKRVADIFSLGCIFYHVLQNGKHPFGTKTTEIRENVLKDNPTLEEITATDHVHGSLPLIRIMIAENPEKRPPAAHILSHPIFWSGKDKLQFFVDVSNLCEKRTLDSDKCSAEVERRYKSEICSGNWDGWIQLTKSIPLQNYLKYNGVRWYTGNSVMELVRAIRNLQNHYAKLPEYPDNIKLILGDPCSDEYIHNWLEKFPYLLHHVWMSFQDLKSQLPKNYYPPSYTFSDLKKI